MTQNSNGSGVVPQDYLEKALNQHGYGFHYAVIQSISTISESSYWSWKVEGTEIPVEVRGAPTHIDILLKHRHHPAYLVAECKRANPRLSNWCFVKAPSATSHRMLGQVLLEFVENSGNGQFMSGMHSVGSGDIYHIPLELKAQMAGEQSGSKGRGAIDDAATQVIRHLNGFVELLARMQNLPIVRRRTFILPAIFTTARLFTCNVNLSEADLLDGNVNLEGCTTKEVPWLYFQYNQSPGLKHSVESRLATEQFNDFIAAEYSRTIAVVNSGGIEDFLNRSSMLW